MCYYDIFMFVLIKKFQHYRLSFSLQPKAFSLMKFSFSYWLVSIFKIIILILYHNALALFNNSKYPLKIQFILFYEVFFSDNNTYFRVNSFPSRIKRVVCQCIDFRLRWLKFFKFLGYIFCQQNSDFIRVVLNDL